MENHSHTYFEIDYIYKGKGIHFLNNSIINYSTGDLFLICPGDRHHFEIKKSTHFIFIKFTESYFKLFNQPEYLEIQPTQIMESRSLKESKLQITPPNSVILKNIIDSIAILANNVDNISHSQLIYHLILSIIALVRDAIAKMDVRFSLAESKSEHLISYIHEHIYNPFDLKIQVIAPHFNIAPKYFSAYFKRVYGIGYSEYINKYRASLIALRISSRQFTIKQVVEEFGFTDESHLSRFFKRYYMISPGAYQKQHIGVPS